MENESGILATEVIHLVKKSLKRIYLLLIIFIILFVLSIADSLYQRHRTTDIVKNYEDRITELITGYEDTITDKICEKHINKGK